MKQMTRRFAAAAVAAALAWATVSGITDGTSNTSAGFGTSPGKQLAVRKAGGGQIEYLRVSS